MFSCQLLFLILMIENTIKIGKGNFRTCLLLKNQEFLYMQIRTSVCKYHQKMLWWHPLKIYFHLNPCIERILQSKNYIVERVFWRLFSPLYLKWDKLNIRPGCSLPCLYEFGYFQGWKSHNLPVHCFHDHPHWEVFSVCLSAVACAYCLLPFCCAHLRKACLWFSVINIRQLWAAWPFNFLTGQPQLSQPLQPVLGLTQYVSLLYQGSPNFILPHHSTCKPTSMKSSV